ncbi:MAG: DUF1194 domain-containing protein [Pseudomonadota bacterium]
MKITPFQNDRTGPMVKRHMAGMRALLILSLACSGFILALTPFPAQASSSLQLDSTQAKSTPAKPALAKSASAKPEVDMLLCMAADVSESVTKADYDLQKKGHADAIRHPEVVAAISGGRFGKIAATYVEWAKQDQQFIAAPWQVIGNAQSASAFGKAIDTAPPPPWITNPVRNTSISEAILFCLRQFENAPVRAARKVIDLSSDGTHNIGAELAPSRQRALEAGAVINALAIVNSDNPYPYVTHENPEGGLPNYFRSNVVGGSGSFVESAEGYEDFARMIRRKFLLEIASIN